MEDTLEKYLDDTTYSNKAEGTFIKYDNTKPMVSLVEPSFILGIAKALTFGAKKYSVDNWKNATKEDVRRVKDSLLRHVLAEEEIDPDSGLPHRYLAACNLMFLDYYAKQGLS